MAARSLYCYRPLTREFLDQRQPSLEALASFEPAVEGLCECEAIDIYVSDHGAVAGPV